MNPAEVAYWSTCRFSAGAYLGYPNRLFQLGQGFVGQGFTNPLQRSDTNLHSGGGVWLTRALRVTRVAWSIFGGTEADRALITRIGSWEWEFNSYLNPGSPLDAFDLGLASLTRKELAELRDLLTDLRNPGTVFGLQTYTEPTIVLPIGVQMAIRLSIGTGERASSVDLEQDTFIRFTIYGLEQPPLPMPPMPLFSEPG